MQSHEAGGGVHVRMCACLHTSVRVCVESNAVHTWPNPALYCLSLITPFIFSIHAHGNALPIIYNTLYILCPLTTGTLQLLMTTNPLLYCMTGLTGFLELDIEKLTMIDMAAYSTYPYIVLFHK